MSGMQQFTLLPVPMPPMLPGTIGIVDTKYFSIFYQGSKATWSNGRAMGTFSYYAVYAPLIEHPALAIHLDRYNLGSDDEPPESAILCDVGEQKMYVGNCREIDRFLQQQHSENELPQLTERELEAALKAVENLSWEQMQRLGMFEMFGSTNPQARQETAKMVEWLDGYITEDLIEQYVRLAFMRQLDGDRDAGKSKTKDIAGSGTTTTRQQLNHRCREVFTLPIRPLN